LIKLLKVIGTAAAATTTTTRIAISTTIDVWIPVAL